MADYSKTTEAADGYQDEDASAQESEGPFNIPPKVRRARDFIKHVLEVEGNQRKREIADLEFQVPENAWTKEAKEARAGGVLDGQPILPRPMVSIPKLDQPITGIINQAKAADLGVTVHPVSEDASDDTAEVMRDLYRMIERDSRAQLARLWALERATKAGRGAYRVLTEYDHDSDHPFDQKIVIKRILRQEMAFFDPSAEEPDWSDGRKAAIAGWVPWETLKQKYKGKKGPGGKPIQIAELEEGEFASLISECPDWVRDSGSEKACLVVEYFEKVYTTETVWGYADGYTEAGEQPSRPWNEKTDQKRTREKCEVRWCKVSGVDVLEEETLNGQYIPLVPVIGRELVPFDAERRWHGIIYPNRDAQRMFNAEASNVLEKSSQGSKQSLWMAEGQEEGHEAALQQANVRNFAYNLYKPIQLDNGQVAPPPFRLPSAAQDLQQHIELLQLAEGFIQAGTAAIDPAALEKLARKKVAHQTLGTLADQSLTGNSDYLWNLAEIATPYEAKVVLDLMPHIYDRPGRVAQLLDQEGDTRAVMLNHPFTVGPNGRPVRAMPQPTRVGAGRTPGAAMMQPGTGPAGPQQPAPEVKHYDLRKGKYAVSVSVGKSYRDRVEQGQDELGALLQADPALMPVLGPIYFKFRDFPGHEEAAELMKRWRAMQMPGLDEGEDEKQKAQQEAAAMKAQLEAQGQQLQEAADYIKTEQAKHDAQIEIERMKQQTQIELQAMKDATSIRVAEINAETKGMITTHEAQHEALAMGLEHAHQRRMTEQANAQAMAQAALGGATAADQAERGHAQQLELGDQQAEIDAQAGERGHEQALEAGDVEHQRALEQQAQAAEMAPEPEPGE